MTEFYTNAIERTIKVYAATKNKFLKKIYGEIVIWWLTKLKEVDSRAYATELLLNYYFVIEIMESRLKQKD